VTERVVAAFDTGGRLIYVGSGTSGLLVSDLNAPAQHFYQAHGYHEVGALTDYVCPGITELIYRKRLH